MNSCNTNFEDTYQKINFQDTGEPKKAVDVLRKCTLLSYSASVEMFDNQSTSQLLTSKLNKLSALVNTETGHIYQDKLNNLLRSKNIFETFSNKIDLKSMFTSLSCSNGDITCSKSESPNGESFKEFMSLFQQKRTKGVLNEPSKHTFSKKFTPQTCNTKVNKFLRQTSDNSLTSEKAPPPKIFETQLLNSKEAKESDKEVKNDQFGFKTAREELNAQNKKYGGASASNVGGQKRKLGARRGVGGKFISPMLSTSSDGAEENSKSQDWGDHPVDERLKNLEPKMVELIKSEIMDCGPTIDWNDIAGLEFAKTSIQEAVVWPMLRPDIFTGLRRPPKGILLFGPPGTGKTLIGKCVASQSKSTFFSISASSLTSKWVGDGEKMVRALFAIARCYQPAVIFIDEIDSLLSQRSETEHESSRRIKTEFLVQLDGATTDSDERLLVIGATNRPQELDEAARRRFVKRLYIPLPELTARFQLVLRLMSGEKHNLSESNMMEIARATEGYSGADMKSLCSDASLGPIRSIDMNLIQTIQTAEVRPVVMEDFRKALSRMKSSVAPSDLEQYIKWNNTYGSSHSV